MGQKARITLTSPNYTTLSDICAKIADVADKTGVKRSGIIPLPTKKLTIPTRKSPCGGGTETYEKWQMRVHKRMIDIESDDRTLRRVMRIDVPEDVQMKIDFKDK